MKILVTGLGLIGGSLCKAIKSHTEHFIVGLDNNNDVVDSALECGAIDEKANDDNISQCDFIIVCLHPEAAEKYMLSSMDRFKKGAVLTDVCGIKEKFVQKITDKAADCGIHYVSTHPMAGKERSGFANSDGKIFENANFIVTPVENTDKNAVYLVVKLAKSIGFGKIVVTSPHEHDKTIAYTSQLAHVVSSAYVKSPSMQNETGFSGGSFQDMTRIATMDENMWSSLFISNKDCLLNEIDTLIDNLSQYRNMIADENYSGLAGLIKEGRLLKEENLKKRMAEHLQENN